MVGLYTVVSKGFDGTVRRTWTCRLVERTGPLLVLEGEFDREIVHRHVGRIARGTVSIEYFWLDRWYNIFRFHQPGGAFRNFYCNIAMPPTLDEASLEFVDLDIDLFVEASGKITVLDEDEFRDNAVKLGYTRDIETAVTAAVKELTDMVRRRDFPFDYPDFPQHSS